MIPLIKPVIPFDSVASDLRAILESGQLTSGRYVARFEKALAEYLGVAHTVTTTSATTALHMAMEAMRIGEGDEVLVSDFSFPASGNAVVQTGASAVFVDCLPGRFDIDPADLSSRITPRSRAVMVVHPFGQPADMVRIYEIASRHSLKVIEDAACGLGTRHGNRMCGTLSDAGCFSFHPRKLLNTGEGGLIATNDSKLHQTLTVLRTHGGTRDEVGLQFVENGFNYRMTEMQAALGLSQLGGFEDSLAERRRIAKIYLDLFAKVAGATVPLSAPADQCTFQSFVILFDDKIDRNRVVASLRAKGIESTLGTYAMHSQPAFKRYGYRAGDLPNSMRAQRQSLTLPLFAGMGDDTVARIVREIAGLI
ncbi:MAG: DegT/DnrJ/EryC1/StrS family aminotransferase [Hyphomicrobium sp.]|nr:DegT/DnrJ/EryC1/StrS family aminotransferase [Hyphomicrobium sp.]